MHAILIFFCFVVLLPIFWLLVISVTPIQDSAVGVLLPHRLDFSSYSFVLRRFTDLGRPFANTVIVTTATVVLTTFCAVLAAYALVHLRLPGRALFIALMVVTLFLPDRLLMLIPIFEINWQLHLLNSPIGLILPYVALNLVISIFIMLGVFQNISPEILDAARMDGSSSWHTLWAVLLPMLANGIIVVAIANFVFAWGEYLMALTMSDQQSAWTLMVVIAGRLGGMGSRVAALYLLFLAPGILIFALFQRYFMRGLAEGAKNVG